MVKKLNQKMTGLSERIFNPKWRVEVDRFLTPDSSGKTPVNVIFLNTLEQDDHKKMFMTAILTEIYSWMLAHPSRDKRPQLFLFFDEVGMFAPPDPKQSPPKEMIRLLFKQGRKYGVSCLLCIQNPADIDYKITSQTSTRALGAIATAQDMSYVKNMFTTESPDLKDIRARNHPEKTLIQLLIPDK
ncbi:MAG: ATP-binding protein [Candidatus Freyarchaeota archaeon]